MFPGPESDPPVPKNNSRRARIKKSRKSCKMMILEHFPGLGGVLSDFDRIWGLEKKYGDEIFKQRIWGFPELVDLFFVLESD